MPSYELALVLKKLSKPELITALKRTARNIWKYDGMLFQIENLGSRKLPYKVSSFGKTHWEGSYFLMRFDASAGAVSPLKDEYERDPDILKSGFVRIQPQQSIEECTLEEELLPPAYRKDVKEMIETGRKKTKKYDMKVGLNYNPFSR